MKNMTSYFKELYEGYCSSTANSVKRVLYDAMVNYANVCRVGYAYYDMDMYTALYKVAESPEHRKSVLKRISEIVDDGALYKDELIKNFKVFISLNKILNDYDIDEFDTICTKALNYFRKILDESEFEAGAGMSDFIPEIPVNVAKGYLKEIATPIIETSREELKSFKQAELDLKRIKKWESKRSYRFWRPLFLFI